MSVHIYRHICICKLLKRAFINTDTYHNFCHNIDTKSSYITIE